MICHECEEDYSLNYSKGYLLLCIPGFIPEVVVNLLFPNGTNNHILTIS